MSLKAPFPYFGGKSRIADAVWMRLGDVANYIEPFAGSLAVLLARPETHSGHVETVNDIDNYIVNFWRAVQADPDAVASWADYPVTETDLTARHLWLVNTGRERIAHLDADPDAYDAQVAGWWVWGLSAWIGGGWCSGTGPWVVRDGQVIKAERAEDENAVSKRIISLGGGKGVHRKRIHLSAAGKGIRRGEEAFPDIYAYMEAIAARLRHVRVTCGDWKRVVTPGAMAHGSSVGIFLDPPYDHKTGRDAGIYNHEMVCSAAVYEWALEHGDDPRLRIALCGYAGEHDMPASWEEVAWTAGGCYKTHRGDTNGRRHLERVWFSPHCLRRADLFEGTNEPTRGCF